MSLDDTIRRALRDEVSGVTASGEARHRLQRALESEGERPKTGRRAVLAAGAVMIVLAGIAAALVGLSREDSDTVIVDTPESTLPLPEEAEQICKDLTGDESTVGNQAVTALPPGFAPDGPTRVRSSGVPDDEPGAMGGVRQVERRFSDPEGRWIDVVDFNAELPAQVIEDAHADATVTTTSVSMCGVSLEGLVTFEPSVTISSTETRTVAGIQEWEDGGQLVIGGPDVARDDVLLVMSGLRRSGPESHGDFSVEDAETIVSSFLRVAGDPRADAADRLPLAEEVHLGLGSELHQARSRTQLADPAAWVIDEETFRAYNGPFSALQLAAGAESTVVTVGEHPHCASPPMPPPDEVAHLTRVSVQPDMDDDASCLQWWTVDFFVNETGQIEAVTLDLWEP